MNHRNNKSSGYKDDRESKKDYSLDFKDTWISQGIDAKGISFAEQFGTYLKNNRLTTSQIRNVYGELKRIQVRKDFAKEKTSFLLLKPKMAYALGRDNRNEGLKQFNSVFVKAYSAIDAEAVDAGKKFNNLVNLMEAILAYHKAAGGK